MLIGIYDPLGAQTDRLRCEVCQNLILSPMNTGILRLSVATVLPFTVLKQNRWFKRNTLAWFSCNSLTVYGIETQVLFWPYRLSYHQVATVLPFTVLKLL